MFKIDKIENENIYFTNGKNMWILYFKGFDYWGKAPKLSIEGKFISILSNYLLPFKF